jgi:anti-sigma regulatory factor (Ser/Thr protein kinase)
MSTTTAVSPACHDGQALRHFGLLYRTPADYLAGVLPFLTDGIAAGEPAFVSVPPANVALLRDSLHGDAAAVQFADMTAIGRNPARIIPAIRRFVDAHDTQRVRFVGEPIWQGRSAEEICEATRHEAMLNTALADTSVDILCPYDVANLGPSVVADAWRTHPSVVDQTRWHNSPHYGDPKELFAGDDPLPAAPRGGVQSIAVEADDLTNVRNFVHDFAVAAGLAARRTHDLVLAAHEIATNTIVHSHGTGVLRLWRGRRGVICEIQDSGHITDPYAGRHFPDDGLDHGRGLWMANQLCDLVQLRSTAAGTIIRLHVNHN